MKIFRALIYFIFPVFIFLIGATFYFQSMKEKELPVYGMAPSFVLTDQKGDVFRSENLKGQVWVADFIFTRCQGQCPIMSSQMLGLQNQSANIQFVSFSADPDFDTPAVLSAYAKRLGADPKRWQFLTGSRDSLNAIAVGFRMNKVDEPLFHSASFILVDPMGRVRGYYDANDAERIERLKKDLRILRR